MQEGPVILAGLCHEILTAAQAGTPSQSWHLTSNYKTGVFPRLLEEGGYHSGSSGLSMGTTHGNPHLVSHQ
ncbi:MAG: hypothetical protein A3E19_05035 [Planctomycetes bacterium RIFCSPHIGHO2_12_FULL_52_36]|nr:MAG: hypothetical protein A3E19_05035 [Planctomycetes bacterium RIFCSPHIGHO2_12_FULL_52_36]